MRFFFSLKTHIAHGTHFPCIVIEYDLSITKGDNQMEVRTIELLYEIKSLIQQRVSNRWLCIRDVVNYTGLSENTIRRSVKRGVLKSSRVTGKLLFKVSSVDQWLNG